MVEERQEVRGRVRWGGRGWRAAKRRNEGDRNQVNCVGGDTDERCEGPAQLPKAPLPLQNPLGLGVKTKLFWHPSLNSQYRDIPQRYSSVTRQSCDLRDLAQRRQPTPYPLPTPWVVRRTGGLRDYVTASGARHPLVTAGKNTQTPALAPDPVSLATGSECFGSSPPQTSGGKS